MPFSQVKDILHRTGDYHGKLADYYHRVSTQTKQEPVKLLAVDLENQHKFMSRQMRAFCQGVAPSVVEAWMQYDPAYDLEGAINEIDPRPENDLSNLFDTGIELNRRLITYYGQLAAVAPSSGPRELFSSLEKCQLESQRTLVNAEQTL